MTKYMETTHKLWQSTNSLNKLQFSFFKWSGTRSQTVAFCKVREKTSMVILHSVLNKQKIEVGCIFLAWFRPTALLKGQKRCDEIQNQLEWSQCSNLQGMSARWIVWWASTSREIWRSTHFIICRRILRLIKWTLVEGRSNQITKKGPQRYHLIFMRFRDLCCRRILFVVLRTAEQWKMVKFAKSDDVSNLTLYFVSKSLRAETWFPQMMHWWTA